MVELFGSRCHTTCTYKTFLITIFEERKIIGRGKEKKDHTSENNEYEYLSMIIKNHTFLSASFICQKLCTKM